MPFNGAGIFVRVRNWVADAAAGIKIRADFHDIEDDGFADGLSQCIARDGQSVVTNNIPMNAKRIVALSDPVDSQDSATKAYADTKLPLAGGTITGDLAIRKTNPTLTLNGLGTSANSIVSQKNGIIRWQMYLGNAVPAESSGNVGSDFYLASYNDGGSLINYQLIGMRSTGLLTVAGNPTAALGIAPKQYVDTSVTNMGNLKVNRAGDTMTGALTLPFSIATSNIYYFRSDAAGWLQWNGGGTYSLGQGGTIWHTGNLNPVTAVRLAGFDGGTVCVGVASYGTGGGITAVTSLDMRYLQYLTPAGWVTVGG